MSSQTIVRVNAFFQDYAQALAENDPAAWGRIYHDSFLFGSPKGAQTVRLEDFLKLIPRRADFTKSLGLTATRLVSVEATPLDDLYTLVRTVWEMDVTPAAQQGKTLQVQASYIVLQVPDGLRIVVQIDHKDLVAALQES